MTTLTLNGAAIAFCTGCGDLTDGADYCSTACAETAALKALYEADIYGGYCCAYAAAMASSATACARCRADWV